MIREDAFDAFTGDHAPDGESPVDLALTAAFGDDRAAENLDALLIAFLDAGVDVDGIANLKGTEGFLAQR